MRLKKKCLCRSNCRQFLPDPRTLVQRWLQHCVLALDLCPFAAPVLRDDSLRIAVSDAIGLPAQLEDFLLELDLLQTCSEGEVSTTLLVFSQGPEEFDDFLELAGEAEALVEEAGLGGLVQLAQFHPRYQFAGEAVDGVSHGVASCGVSSPVRQLPAVTPGMTSCLHISH